jgi:hypothetical protein
MHIFAEDKKRYVFSVNKWEGILSALLDNVTRCGRVDGSLGVFLTIIGHEAQNGYCFCHLFSLQ